ncbi:hypothetical protein LCGC14_2665300 [marine sediment metagenome]|uniref:Uncharacterized protein n=1 Tax=marine sediment metagenome TaxID=412755 RepID=A0A0F9C0V0_9ZZZZ
MKFRRKKSQPHKELQSEDAGLTANDVMTDNQVQEFTNTIEADRDYKLGKVTN